jgi:hypothetical protein
MHKFAEVDVEKPLFVDGIRDGARPPLSERRTGLQ